MFHFLEMADPCSHLEFTGMDPRNFFEALNMFKECFFDKICLSFFDGRDIILRDQVVNGAGRVSAGAYGLDRYGRPCKAVAACEQIGYIGLQGFFASTFGAEFKDFAGSIVVHAFGGWAALAAVWRLGARQGRYSKGRSIATPPSSIPWLAMGSWLLCIGWFGFNVMSAQSLKGISGLVAINSLMAMSGGIIVALIAGRNDPGFVHNGALAGLVAVCAGSDIMHPIGALVVGGVAGWIFVFMFQVMTNEWKLDDVLGVWPLHGLCGLWGGVACGIFGLKALGGLGGVSMMTQVFGSLAGAAAGFVSGLIVYTIVDVLFTFRMSADDERIGADLAIHKIGANPEDEVRGGRVA